MADVVDRTTKQYLRSVNTPDYPIEDWIHLLTIAAIAALPPPPSKYWLISGDNVTLMDQVARDAVDAAEAAAAVAADKTEQKARVDNERILKALALVVMDELNILRAQHSLADRTSAQLITAIKNKVDTI